MDYLLQIVFLIAIYTVLAVSLDLLMGHTGLMSMAHAGFYSLGAYSSAIVTLYLGAPFFAGVFAGIIFAALVSILVSAPSLRVREDYFVIATFGFQMIISTVLKNWINVTGGQRGIAGIPTPSFFGRSIQSRAAFVILAVLFAIVSYTIVWLIAKNPYGRVLRAIREDEVFAQTLGKNTLRFKISVFAITAALAASAGSLYAHYVTYIDPTSFTVLESILVISMVIIGGAGSRWGPLIGATTLVVLPEALRFVGFTESDQVAANIRQILYGVLLVLMMLARPRGLLGKYNFGR